LGADTVVARQYAYAHSTLLAWALMGLCAVCMDIVELRLMGGERHDEKGWKVLSSLYSEDGPWLVTQIHIFLSFGKHYLRVPGAIKAVPVHKIVPKKRRCSYGPEFCS
jgi:hypothetical protein